MNLIDRLLWLLQLYFHGKRTSAEVSPLIVLSETRRGALCTDAKINGHMVTDGGQCGAKNVSTTSLWLLYLRYCFIASRSKGNILNHFSHTYRYEFRNNANFFTLPFSTKSWCHAYQTKYYSSVMLPNLIRKVTLMFWLYDDIEFIGTYLDRPPVWTLDPGCIYRYSTLRSLPWICLIFHIL